MFPTNKKQCVRSLIMFMVGLSGPAWTAAAQHGSAPTLDRSANRPHVSCDIDYSQMPSQRGVYSPNYWIDGIVPYTFDANVTASEQEAMIEAMAEVSAAAPIYFVLRTNQDDYIHIRDSTINSSAVGRVGGAQNINIYNWNKKFTMVHELMHALGVWHEQQRADRDQYVQIEWDNIEAGKAHNFTMQPSAIVHGTYNFESVMHYGSCGFSVCDSCSATNEDCRTISVPFPHSWAQTVIGQRNSLSNGDILLLQEMYPLAPENDLCLNALPISAGPHVFNNRSGNDDSTGSCDGIGHVDVWYSITTTCPCTVTVDTCGSNFDTVLTVFAGGCANRTEVACNNNAGPGSRCYPSYSSSVTFTAVGAATYLICVASHAGVAREGDLYVSISDEGAANTTCESSMAVGANSATAFDTTCGSLGGAASCTYSSDAPALWYRMTAAHDGYTTIDVCDAEYDSVLSVFQGTSCGSLQEFACNDDHAEPTLCAQPFASRVSMLTTAGQEYFIRVSGYGFDHGAGTMSISSVASNSACEIASPINDGPHAFDLSYGEVDPAHAPACGDSAAAKALWYTYTSPCTTDVRLETCTPGASADTVLSVETGPCHAPVQVACNDTGGTCAINPAAAGLTFTATAGTTYRIRVSSNDAGGQPGILDVQTLGLPRNSTCNLAQPVSNGTTNFIATCASVTAQTASCGAAGPTSSLWFAYTSDCEGTVTMDTCGSGYDTVLSVYSGACGHLTEIACDDDNGADGTFCPGSLHSHVAFAATVGQTYFVRVSSYSGQGSAGRLNIVGASPTSTSCFAAATATNGANTFTTICARLDAVVTCANSSASPAIWYNYTPGCNGLVSLDTCGSGFDTVVSVFTGNCHQSVPVACNDDAPLSGAPCRGTASFLTFLADDDTTYLIRVSGWSDSTGNGVMNLTCTPAACPCDWNRSGELNSQDFFDFITAFFDGRADYNQSGSTTSQDFFDFLACFFSGC